MINKPLDEINEKILQSLKENEIPESKTIEYKKEINLKLKEEKKEFLADVSSFANTMGGDLIIGIEEDKGIPIKIDGIKINNIDNYKNRLESIIRDSIIPRITSANIKEVKISNGNYVIIIRINKSWLAPHQVVHDGLLYSRENSGRFYKRHTGGKHPMDVYELKDAFLLSETIYDKIRTFKEKRIDKILKCDTPTPIEKKHYIVLHIIPISSFYQYNFYHLDIQKCYNSREYFLPIYFTTSENVNQYDSVQRKYNFDGFVKYFVDYKDYIQVFRNGIIEAVENRFFDNYNERFHITYFEELIIKAISKYFENYKNISIEPPFAIYISIFGLKEYPIKTSRIKNWRYGEEFKTENENLILPEIIINNFEINIESILKDYFDMIWNAYGIPESLNYENGNWQSKF